MGNIHNVLLKCNKFKTPTVKQLGFLYIQVFVLIILTVFVSTNLKGQNLVLELSKGNLNTNNNSANGLNVNLSEYDSKHWDLNLGLGYSNENFLYTLRIGHFQFQAINEIEKVLNNGYNSQYFDEINYSYLSIGLSVEKRFKFDKLQFYLGGYLPFSFTLNDFQDINEDILDGQIYIDGFAINRRNFRSKFINFLFSFRLQYQIFKKINLGIDFYSGFRYSSGNSNSYRTISYFDSEKEVISKVTEIENRKANTFGTSKQLSISIQYAINLKKER